LGFNINDNGLRLPNVLGRATNSGHFLDHHFVVTLVVTRLQNFSLFRITQDHRKAALLAANLDIYDTR
jgi:hypothetical protein